MKQSAVLVEDYPVEHKETEAEIQELRDQIHRLRLAMEEAARVIWIKPTQAERILSIALK